MKEQQSREQEWQEQQEFEQQQGQAPFDHMAHANTSEATKVSPSDTTKEKPSWAEITVDVVIPAWNEESCIEGLLLDVIMAKQDNWFEIQHIYVISDASTDQTDDIVQHIATRDQRVKLIRKQERKGKQDSMNLAFSVTTADVVVFVDADVRLASEHTILKLVQYFRDGKTALVQGGVVRIHPGLSLNPAKLAAYFDWILWHRIRRQKTISAWSIDGRVMALSRDFCRHLDTPCFLAEDQYIFYSCIQQDRKFAFAEDAIFYYGPPKSIADFSHQWSRYFFYANKSRQYFGEELVTRDMMVPPGRWRVIISEFIRHPHWGLMWALCMVISKVEFMRGVNFEKYERGFFETKSEPLGIQHVIPERK